MDFGIGLMFDKTLSWGNPLNAIEIWGGGRINLGSHQRLCGRAVLGRRNQDGQVVQHGRSNPRQHQSCHDAARHGDCAPGNAHAIRKPIPSIGVCRPYTLEHSMRRRPSFVYSLFKRRDPPASKVFIRRYQWIFGATATRRNSRDGDGTGQVRGASQRPSSRATGRDRRLASRAGQAHSA